MFHIALSILYPVAVKKNNIWLSTYNTDYLIAALIGFIYYRSGIKRDLRKVANHLISISNLLGVGITKSETVVT